MYTYIVLFTLFTFCSVTVSAVVQEVLNIAKCIADIHQELPKSCVYIMKSEAEEQGENNFFPRKNVVFLEKMCSDFASTDSESLLENRFLEIMGHV